MKAVLTFTSCRITAAQEAESRLHFRLLYLEGYDLHLPHLEKHPGSLFLLFPVSLAIIFMKTERHFRACKAEPAGRNNGKEKQQLHGWDTHLAKDKATQSGDCCGVLPSPEAAGQEAERFWAESEDDELVYAEVWVVDYR